MAIGYMALIAKAAESGYFKWLLARASEIGKMALSCYICITSLQPLSFSVGGCDWVIKSKSPGILFFWALITAIMSLFAHLWLPKFSLGPVE
ncbi:DUF418 domain-containing protein [Paenibacillus sp. GCM10012307]|nr:DUF418 domain-containing protein [Paenibacillus roseus]